MKRNAAAFVLRVRWLFLIVPRSQNAVGARIHRADDMIHHR